MKEVKLRASSARPSRFARSKRLLHHRLCVADLHLHSFTFSVSREFGGTCDFPLSYIDVVAPFPLSEPVWHWPAVFFFLQGIWFLLLTYWHVSGPWTTIYKGLLKISSIWDARRKKQAHPWIKLCLAEEAAAHRPGVIHAPAAVMIPEIWREGFLLGICQPPTWKRKIWKTCSASMGK